MLKGRVRSVLPIAIRGGGGIVRGGKQVQSHFADPIIRVADGERASLNWQWEVRTFTSSY